MSQENWYQEGLRFQCRGCGQCCTGEPGYVWVTEEEIAQMSQKMGVSPRQFESNFVRRIGKKGKSLIEVADGDCVFFDSDSKKCIVYDVRPVQCRTWPFWEQNLDSKNGWKKTAKFCRGCNHPQGHLFSPDEINQRRAQTFGPTFETP